jgi:hypothetical protein
VNSCKTKFVNVSTSCINWQICREPFQQSWGVSRASYLWPSWCVLKKMHLICFLLNAYFSLSDCWINEKNERYLTNKHRMCFSAIYLMTFKLIYAKNASALNYEKNVNFLTVYIFFMAYLHNYTMIRLNFLHDDFYI